MKRLYRITTHFWGKDLDEGAILGYVVADSPEEVAEHISQKVHGGEWFGYESDDGAEAVEETRLDYIAKQGDFHTEPAGEFYDQKYGWEEVGEVTDEQVTTLAALKITEPLRVAK
ncbi:MAG: hypothetical protein A2762_02570 [Candidatus Lloydbacteria bacterium RIFCSPHIGHO2_01_FULL_54_11]|nr:MAG: hypothetical protein A2762_02570 [Candidatus Lloydbacteria bacterium RIFCSPHIGHO2_01_FULL_54_11]